MSSDQRPGRMRVVSAARDAARRRGDGPGVIIDHVARQRSQGSAVWSVIAAFVFLGACLAGGALLLMSGMLDISRP